MTEEAKPVICSCGANVDAERWVQHLRYGDPAKRHVPSRPQREQEAQE